MADPVVVRIAPSPTGDPHVGTAYVALFDYVLRQQRGGRFILRIDDTDRTRYQADSEEAILRELRWLGLAWDEGADCGGPHAPYRQSERTEIYRAAADELIQKGGAYRCDCTKERLDEVRTGQRARKEQPRYDGHCRDRNVSADATHVVRLKMPREGTTEVQDGVRGVVTFQNSTIDDQVLLKSDGFPTYHLATVVDDHKMGVTHVLRAEEWLNSTPKHVRIYEGFGWPLPAYFHLPLLRNSDKSKISKRKNHTSLTWYRKNGFLPEAMLNFLALMGFSYGDDREEFTVAELTEVFDPGRIQTSAPVFDLKKLEWLNGVYIRNLPLLELAARVRDISPLAKEIALAELCMVLPIVQERMHRLTDFDELCRFFFVDEVEVPMELLVPKKRDTQGTAAALEQALPLLEGDAPLDVETLEADLRARAEGMEWKARELFMALRVAVTGQKVTPPLIESMVILGQNTCRARIGRAIEALRSAGA